MTWTSFAIGLPPTTNPRGRYDRRSATMISVRCFLHAPPVTRRLPEPGSATVLKVRSSPKRHDSDTRATQNDEKQRQVLGVEIRALTWDDARSRKALRSIDNTQGADS
jgi:hypothetical protein